MYNSCAQVYAHKCEQFLNLHLVRFRLVFVYFRKGFLCSFVCFRVSLDHFGFLQIKLVLLMPSVL